MTQFADFGYEDRLIKNKYICPMLLASIILGVFGPQEVIIIAVIILLLFGGRKIPELMKGLGKGIKEFKDASKGEETDKISDKKD